MFIRRSMCIALLLTLLLLGSSLPTYAQQVPPVIVAPSCGTGTFGATLAAYQIYQAPTTYTKTSVCSWVSVDVNGNRIIQARLRYQSGGVTVYTPWTNVNGLLEWVILASSNLPAGRTFQLQIRHTYVGYYLYVVGSIRY